MAAPGETAFAAAVSGGPDSMALCRLLSLWAAAQKPGPVIHMLTVDHGLRPESAAEARQVGVWIRGWPQVRHKILKPGKAELDPAEGRLMERAREVRYRLMADYCRKERIGKLFLAHHRDDQAETFLFRLAKGSGLDGLAAMRPVQPYDGELTLLRPLLETGKDDLVSFCQSEGIPFIEDPTNRNPGFARSRLRQGRDILAREGLTAKRLAVTAQRLARAQEALDFYAGCVLEKALINKTERIVNLDFETLAGEPAETRLRVLLLAMQMLREAAGRDKGYGPRRERLEDLAESLFSSGAGFRKRTLGGLIVSRDPKKATIVLQIEESRK